MTKSGLQHDRSAAFPVSLFSLQVFLCAENLSVQSLDYYE